MLRSRPERAERHGFGYFRHGALFALCGIQHRQPESSWARPPSRRTSAEFVAFLEEAVASVEPGRGIHIIADNLSTQKTKAVEAFLSEHPHVHLPFTPTTLRGSTRSKSRLSKIQRDIIVRGVFESISQGKSCDTSATTTKRRSPSDKIKSVYTNYGATKYPPSESDEPFTFICYSALVHCNR